MSKGSFQNRVVWYHFILGIFVVLISAQNTAVFTEQVLIDGKPVFNQIENFIVSDIAVIGTAGFFFCSGYLFYRNYSWKKVLEKYKTRLLGLFLPYVLWTLIYYFIHVLVSYIPPLRSLFQEQQIKVTWQGIVDAVLNHRYAAFLWFLQFLIIFVIVSPIIYLLISNKYIGIAAIVIVLVIDSVNGVFLRNFMLGNIQVSVLLKWLFLYMAGGYIGIHCNKAVEGRRTSWTLLAASLILAALSYYFFKHSPGTLGNLFYFLLFSIALWCLIDKLPLPGHGDWQKNTFIVYLIHYPVVQGINGLVSEYLSRSMWPGIILFFLLPFICFALAALLKRMCGKGNSFLWKLLSGNR